MTAAQRDYLTSHGIDPWSLCWENADAAGFERWGKTEAAHLPDGQVLLADGRPRPSSVSDDRSSQP